MSAPLQLDALTVVIGGRRICAALDAAVRAGELVAVLGPNGAGKSTLLHTLAGLYPATSGAVRLAGDALAALPRRRVAQRLGLMMQHHEDPFPATVLETALIGRHPHIGFWMWESAEDVARAREALARFDLAGFEDRDVHTLSGGERRRLAAATVVVQDPLVYLLDEPTDGLDPRHAAQLLASFRALADAGRAVVVSMHDVNEATRVADRVLLLYGDGQTLLGPAGEVLTIANLERLYGIPLAAFEHGGRRHFLPR
jgi:iron complex transport system ATP-binding protein